MYTVGLGPYICGFKPLAETWRRVWGDGTNFRGPRFLNDVFFGKNFPTFFSVIDQVFLIFRIFTVLNVVYDRRKTTISEKNSLMTPFFTLFVLSRAFDNTTSQNIGGTDAWAIPHLKFGGTVPRPP